MRGRSVELWPLALVGGALVGGGVLVALLGRRQTAPSLPASRLPAPPAAAIPAPAAAPLHPAAAPPPSIDLNVEAAARMLASENPRGDDALHIEQVWTQIRARKPGQSLYDRITAGSGWGPQGQSAPGGRRRPVATTEPATEAGRQLVREVLAGKHPSTLPGARKFFEPAEQDRAFAIAETARKKQKAGQALSEKEQRLLGYHRDAAGVRKKWTAEGARLVGTLGTVEFYT